MPSLTQITRRTAALLLISTLAACGGGGGDGGSGAGSGGGSEGGGNTGGGDNGGGNNGGGTGGGTGNQAVTGTYKMGGQTATSHAQMLDAANSMGADGYALFSSWRARSAQPVRRSATSISRIPRMQAASSAMSILQRSHRAPPFWPS